MRILTLDAYLEGRDVTQSEFRSATTIFEYDVAIWDPANTLETYQISSYYKGHPRISDHDTVAIAQDIGRRRKEFQEFLDMGRTLAIFVAPSQYFWYATGKRGENGTGRSGKASNIIDRADLAELVTPTPFSVTTGEGTRITARHQGYRSLLSANVGRWWYRAILDEFPGDSLAVVTGTNKCVGAIHRNEKGGILLLLPDFLSPDDTEVRQDVEEIDDLQPIDSKEELQSTAETTEQRVDQAFLDLVAWMESLRTTGTEPPPAWIRRYRFAEDAETAQKIAELEKEKNRICAEIAEFQANDDVSNRWKRLLYASGDELEDQVMAAFSLLGFNVKRGPEGRADIILESETQRAVVEVKGLNGSAAEKNAAQLEKWISEEMLSGSGKAKGILVVNSHRQLPVDARSAPAFPHQMVTFSTPREHCLVTSVQLLAMVRVVMEDASRAPAIAEILMQTNGTISGWDDVAGLFVS